MFLDLNLRRILALRRALLGISFCWKQDHGGFFDASLRSGCESFQLLRFDQQILEAERSSRVSRVSWVIGRVGINEGMRFWYKITSSARGVFGRLFRNES